MLTYGAIQHKELLQSLWDRLCSSSQESANDTVRYSTATIRENTLAPSRAVQRPCLEMADKGCMCGVLQSLQAQLLGLSKIYLNKIHISYRPTHCPTNSGSIQAGIVLDFYVGQATRLVFTQQGQAVFHQDSAFMPCLRTPKTTDAAGLLKGLIEAHIRQNQGHHSV